MTKMKLWMIHFPLEMSKSHAIHYLSRLPVLIWKPALVTGRENRTRNILHITVGQLAIRGQKALRTPPNSAVSGPCRVAFWVSRGVMARPCNDNLVRGVLRIAIGCKNKREKTFFHSLLSRWLDKTAQTSYLPKSDKQKHFPCEGPNVVL